MLFYTTILVITFIAAPHRIIIIIHHVASWSSVASSDEKHFSSLSQKKKKKSYFHSRRCWVWMNRSPLAVLEKLHLLFYLHCQCFILYFTCSHISYNIDKSTFLQPTLATLSPPNLLRHTYIYTDHKALNPGNNSQIFQLHRGLMIKCLLWIYKLFNMELLQILHIIPVDQN